ncbi:MAG: hypothetical protein CMJ78_22145 [Planctomycetaceae bacterium]|nr:hypothetical protein [Planctomycetaceae bacterium]
MVKTVNFNLIRLALRWSMLGLFAFALLVGRQALAQVGPNGFPPQMAPPGMAPPGMAPPAMAPPGIQPAGYSMGHPANTQMSHQGLWYHDYETPMYGSFQYEDNIREERLPDDRGFLYGESPIDQFIKNVAKSTWVRVEYMNYRFENPGSALLGTDVLGIVNPRDEFPVTVSNQNFGNARVADLGAISLRDNNGVRTTIGIPIGKTVLEANIMSFEESSDHFVEDELGVRMNPPGVPPSVVPIPPLFIATSTKLNGEPANNLFLYDNRFEARYSTDFWGVEANLVIDTSIANQNLKLRPIVGFRYMELTERLTQLGVFDQQGGLDPPLNSIIDSEVDNRIYAPQVGLRFEGSVSRVSFGLEPKVGMGVNVFDANVNVIQLRSPADPTIFSEDADEKFSPYGNLTAYLRWHLSQNVSFYLGYDFLWLAKVSRPFANINYNDNGSQNDAAIVVDPGFDNMTIQGVTVGAEFRFR